MTAGGNPAYREIELDMTVVARGAVSDGVVAVTLADPDGGDLPRWTPGAHIDLVMSPSLTRQYSLCGSTADRKQWRVGVLLDPDSRGGSQFVHDKLHEGATVRVRGPRNHFALVNSPKYQFIAGGIGITPILTMIEEARARGADWQLLYGGRQRASMAFLDELAGDGDRVTVWPQDERGMLDLNSVLGAPRDDTLVYCCGPEGLLGAVESACAGWPDGSLHIERFAAKVVAPSADALDSGNSRKVLGDSIGRPRRLRCTLGSCAPPCTDSYPIRQNRGMKMPQIFMLIMLYVAVISGPLIGGIGAGYKAVKKWNADRGARTPGIVPALSPAVR